jgi:CHAT domain-containing protein
LAHTQAETEMTGKFIILALGGALVLASAPVAAQGQTRADLIPLGRSAASGAVCQAVRDYDDPVVQGAGRRAWNVRCRGWEGNLGRLYVLPQPEAVGAWQQALSGRATCQDAKTQALGGLSTVSRRPCTGAAARAPYVVYEARKGGGLYAAEGVAQIADVLETGLRVVAGAARPPMMSEVQTSAASAEIAADFGGSSSSLARAQEAAEQDPARLRTRGYVQNNEWRFNEAETDFQALVTAAEARNAPPREQAEALLNLALNISNNGRFPEAERRFADADGHVARARDPLLTAQALTYKALHHRNKGEFRQAVDTARQALQAQQQVRRDRGLMEGGPTVATTPTGEVAITRDLSHALNVRPAGRSVLGSAGVSEADRLAVQEAQTHEVIGSSLGALGDTAGAREALTRAGRVLTAAEANGAANAWLRARIEADIADLEFDAGQPGAAADRLGAALTVLRRRHAATAAEGGLLLSLGRAQAAAGRENEALDSYGRAFKIFQEQRGALGASADEAAPYFDLLLKRIAEDAANADSYRERYFQASESVVSNSTAQTVSKLAARVASGDGSITGLVRALEDTRRELRATEAQISALQADGAYGGEDKVRLEAALRSLTQQSDTLEAELLAANPRYAQLVSSEATLEQLKKALRPDEVFVKVLLLGSGGYGILVSQAGATPYPIAMTREEAAAAVRAIRSPFQAEDSLPAFDVARAHDLFNRLMGPVAGEVMKARHLIYEPDGALISLPVATLVMQDPAPLIAGGKEADYRRVAWLGARLDSSLVLSAASFMQSRAFQPSQAKKSFIAFADPAPPKGEQRAFSSVLRRGVNARRGGGDIAAVCESTRQALLQLPPLPDTADEVRQVGARLGGADSIVTGQSFSDATVKARNDLSDYRVLYFATHGLLPQPSACLPEPALVTSVGEGVESDGLLDTTEILDLKLDADLVVLSACDTGGAGSGEADLTGLQGGGEALGGLTRAVIYAGGRSLVVSHWAVDSAATVRLMTGLFAAGAPTTAESLQKAQVALQQSGDWSHPYFWAPFTLVGDGARPLPAAEPRTQAD